MAGEIFDAGDVRARISVDGTEVDKGIEKANASLASFARDMKKLGRDLTQAITVPLVGIATAAFRFSDEASAAFKRFGDSTAKSMGKLGTDIARSINLEGLLTTVAGFIAGAVKWFGELDPVTKRFVINLLAISAALGPIILIGAKLLAVFVAIGAFLGGPVGIVLFVALAAAVVGVSYAMAKSADTSKDWYGRLTKEEQALAATNTEYEQAIHHLRTLEGLRDTIAKEDAAKGIRRTMPDAGIGRIRQSIGMPTTDLENLSVAIDDARQAVQLALRQFSQFFNIFSDLRRGAIGMGEALRQGFQDRANAPAKALRDILEDVHNQLAIMPRDWNANEAAVSALRSKYVELQRDGFSAEALEPLRAKIQELSDPTANFIAEIQRSTQATYVLKDAWNQFIELLRQTPSIGQQIGTLLFNIWTQFHEGVGQTVAQALVYGQSLAKGFQDFFKRLAATIIATLISIGIQWLVLKLIGAGFAASQAGKDIGGAAGAAGAWAYAAAVKSQGLIGLATGLGFGAIAIAAALGLGAAGIAGGKGVAAGMSSSYSGGIFTRPTISAIAERGPEMVLNQKNIRGVFGAMGGRGYTIEINLDGSSMLRYFAENLPEHLRLNGAA